MRLSSYSTAVVGGVGQADGVALDGDAPLPFDVHGVQDLVAELAVLHHAGPLDEAVRQGGLAVVDMGDDAEVADVGHSNRKGWFQVYDEFDSN